MPSSDITQTQPTSHEPCQGDIAPSDDASSIVIAHPLITGLRPWQIRLLYRIQVTGDSLRDAGTWIRLSYATIERLERERDEESTPFGRACALIERRLALIPADVARKAGAEWVPVLLEDARIESQRQDIRASDRNAARRLYLEAEGTVGRGAQVQVNVLNASSAMWDAWQREQAEAPDESRKPT